MSDPSPLEADPLAPAAEDAPAAAPLPDPFDPLEPVPFPAEPMRDAQSIYAQEVPPDNEHGDGVRNPADRPCAGIKGNGMLTPKIPVKSEDWKDYNYSDFSY